MAQNKEKLEERKAQLTKVGFGIFDKHISMALERYGYMIMGDYI